MKAFKWTGLRSFIIFNSKSRLCCGRWTITRFPNRLHSQFYVDFCEIVIMTSRTMSLKPFLLSCQNPHHDKWSHWYTELVLTSISMCSYIKNTYGENESALSYNLTFFLYASYIVCNKQVQFSLWKKKLYCVKLVYIWNWFWPKNVLITDTLHE